LLFSLHYSARLPTRTLQRSPVNTKLGFTWRGARIFLLGDPISSVDGASELLQDVFGPDKNPSRLVYGVASLPLGVPVELEVILEVST